MLDVADDITTSARTFSNARSPYLTLYIDFLAEKPLPDPPSLSPTAAEMLVVRDRPTEYVIFFGSLT